MHSVPSNLLSKEKRRDELVIQQQLGTALRACLDHTLVEPMPESLRRLLKKLEVEAPRPRPSKRQGFWSSLRNQVAGG